MENIKKGDYILFEYCTKEIYPARILEIQGDKVKVEMCINKRKNACNETEIAEGTLKQIKGKIG